MTEEEGYSGRRPLRISVPRAISASIFSPVTSHSPKEAPPLAVASLATTARAVASGVLLLIVCAARADEPLFDSRGLLESYEPNTIGYTKDSDDVGFMDFKISVKYQIFPDEVYRHVGRDERAYFAFTGRFGQYLGTRDSSPVVGKRFNPKLFWRHATKWEPGHEPSDSKTSEEQAKERPMEYLDFALAHESNGQSINTPEQFQQARAQAQRPEFANDNISRGWDYLEFTWKKVPSVDENHRLSTYLTLKYFLPHGPFQGRPEEFNVWETDPEGKPRKSVNGVVGMAKYQKKWNAKDWFSDPKFALVYETGYLDPFKYNTVRVEAGVKVLKLPVTLWGQYGYGSDLAQYYKKVSSWGLELEIGSF
jgi:hypothetical protein